MVNGSVIGEATEPPYSFAGIPRVVQDFTIYALVRDTAGNIKASEKILVSTEKFLGSGIAVSLNMADGLEIESNSTLLLSADASSEFGIAEMEFFLDGQSLGINKISESVLVIHFFNQFI